MRVDQFDFDLPERLIALEPARPRESARLLHVQADGRIGDWTVADAPNLLRPGDVLVVNDTRVIAAALQGARPGRAGGPAVAIEALLHQRVDEARWRTFAKPLKRLKPSDRIQFGADLEAVVESKDASEIVLCFDKSGIDLDAAIEAAGAPPLPPYITARRGLRPEDAADYQTMFAARPGAVAAPTAGLHFTPALMRALETRGVDVVALTLHVGAGTFLPMKAEDTDAHRMHAEWRAISEDAAAKLNAARMQGRRIVAVGTTALRALESSAAEDGALAPTAGETDIFITPGYRFKAVDALWTNFHLPRSTLFMLIAAFIGLERARQAYAHAIAQSYRFYSFGDACLFERPA